MSAITPTVELGHNESAAASSLLITVGVAVPIGDTVFVGIANRTPARTVSTVTDSRGNSYTIRGTPAGTNSRATIFDCIGLTTALQIGDTITVTLSGSAAFGCSAFAAHGLAAVPHDQAGTNTGTGTSSFTVQTVGATAQTDEIAVVCYGYGSTSGTPFPSNGGYTAIADRFFSTGGIWFGYRILTSAAIESAAQTCGSANSFAGTIETYAAAAAPAAVPVRSLRVGRSRAALRARLRRRPALLRGRSVTTPTPLVRRPIYAKRHRRGAVVARRKHRNVVYSRPPARFAPLVFVRPAITVVRHARQAVLARRKHDRPVVVRAPQGSPRPRPPIVIARRQPRLVARRRHRTVAPVVRPPAVSLFRRAAQIIVRKARAPLAARRKHRTGLLTRPRVEPARRPAPVVRRARGTARRLIRRLPHLIRPASRPAAAPSQPVAVHAELADRAATDATITDTLAAIVQFGDSPTVAAVIDDTDATEATTRDTPTPDATTDDGP